MSNAVFRVPDPVNEPVRAYESGSHDRGELKGELQRMRAEKVEVPIMIGGKEHRSGDVENVVCPHEHSHVLGSFHNGGGEHVLAATKACAAAAKDWAATPWEQRAAVFLKAADLLEGPWRKVLNASTMLGQSKNAYQAEIDAACELIDFWRFNARFMEELYREQPVSGPGCWNRVEQRALEGFVFAVTPFNFTSIAANLPTAPAMMGCTAIWKPSSTAVLSGYYIMKLLEAAGLPPGVVNFIPGDGPTIGTPTLAHPDLAGVHFTGSTGVFQTMWRTVGANIEKYRSYPRIVGETGGKDFIFAHPSAHVDALVVAMVRGAFEYQGQKCSAASRAYIPASIWPQVKEQLVEMVSGLDMGPPEDFSNFVNAVIDQRSFDKCKSYIEHAKAASDAEILVGGECDDSQGYFVRPTVIETTNPRYKSICEEIFGPILTVQVYDDNKIDEALKDCDEASPYALTGAIFAQDRGVITELSDALRHSAGNFYINDKPTGAVVGQQPFGGSRASGTNDKAGSKLNLMRWTSVRTIKETFVPAVDYRYPFMS